MDQPLDILGNKLTKLYDLLPEYNPGGVCCKNIQSMEHYVEVMCL